MARARAAEGECRRLQHVIDSAVCVLNADGTPEVLADHPLVECVTSLVGPANELATENGRLRDALAGLLRWFEACPEVLPGAERWRLQSQIRHVLYHKGSVK